jgi:hypothetical protein
MSSCGSPAEAATAGYHGAAAKKSDDLLGGILIVVTVISLVEIIVE